MNPAILRTALTLSLLVAIPLSLAAAGPMTVGALEGCEVSKLDISNAPGPEAMSGRRKARAYAVTDLEYIDGQLCIAGLSNEEFASSLRRAAFPFDGKIETTGLEIFHGAHGSDLRSALVVKARMATIARLLNE